MGKQRGKPLPPVPAAPPRNNPAAGTPRPAAPVSPAVRRTREGAAAAQGHGGGSSGGGSGK